MTTNGVANRSNEALGLVLANRFSGFRSAKGNPMFILAKKAYHQAVLNPRRGSVMPALDKMLVDLLRNKNSRDKHLYINLEKNKISDDLLDISEKRGFWVLYHILWV